jgi:glycosyltransferase AglE
MRVRALDNLPFVSVIVPAYNAAGFISKLLDALQVQDYPEDKREIIIVDNGSKDNTKAIATKYPFILLEENEIQSSYAARNKGIAAAKGDIIAFTDADCVPVSSWITEGVKSLTAEQAALVAGDVRFVYSAKTTATEIYDSITHMQMEADVCQKGVAPTANLFVKRQMFAQIGLFDGRVKSGGDFQWTGKATAKGYKLTFSKAAAVHHPTRRFSEFLKKVIRTGAGSAHKRLAAGHNLLHEFFYMPYAVFFKINLDKKTLKQRFDERGLSKLNISFSRVIWVGVFMNIAAHISAMVEFWRILVLMILRKYEVRRYDR